MKKKSTILLSFGLVLFWMVMPTASAQDSDRLADQHFKKALDLLKQTQYLDAIAEYEKVISMLPESEIALDAKYWIGQSYFQMGRHDEALSVFKKLVKENPKSAIAPVTHLMVTRVQKDKENKKLRVKSDKILDEKIIIDSRTGLKYTKIWALTGKKSVDEMAGFNLSPNGKFLLNENLVIPLSKGDPFNLVAMDASRGNWSPDGKNSAFYSGDAIWIVPVSPETGRPTGPPKKLLDGKFQWQGPASWSPDSEKIVFASRFEESKGDIWTISVKEGVKTQITDDPSLEFNPIWSPDGKTIAFSKGWQLWAVSSRGGEPWKIINRGRQVSWSPDSKWIVYTTPGMKFHMLRLADKLLIDIDPPAGVGRFLSWSPDGKKMIFYRSSYDYSCLLKVVSISGGPSFELGREFKLWPYNHFWTPDSKMIITEGGYPIEIKYKDKLDFWVIPIAGGEARPINLDVPGVNKPQPRALSHDGKRLLFFENQGRGKEDLYVMPVSLKEARSSGPAVMVFKGRDKKPVGFGRRDEWDWSNDGEKLAVVHEGDIWVTPVDKGKPLRITEKPEQETWPLWSPDGKRIAYIENVSSNKKDERKKVLYVIPAAGGKAIKIGNVFSKETFDWSPNGKELAVISDGKILVYPVSKGKSREIFDLDEFQIERTISFCWLPDGKHFALLGEKQNICRMYLVSEKGDKVVELAADDQNWKDWLYPSPDGKWISYDSEGSIKVRSECPIWEVDFEEFVKKEKD